MSTRLSLRRARATDADLINAYWAENTEEDLVRLGELARPDARGNAEFLRDFCATPLDPRTAPEDLRIWCVDGAAVGYSSLKEIHFGRDAQIHLHFWEKSLRRKGYGSILFCLSALSFIRAFELRRLFCQPKIDNPFPNGLLTRIGFPARGPVDYLRRDGSTVVQRRFEILPDVAYAYLESARPRAGFELPPRR